MSTRAEEFLRGEVARLEAELDVVRSAAEMKVAQAEATRAEATRMKAEAAKAIAEARATEASLMRVALERIRKFVMGIERASKPPKRPTPEQIAEAMFNAYWLMKSNWETNRDDARRYGEALVELRTNLKAFGFDTPHGVDTLVIQRRALEAGQDALKRAKAAEEALKTCALGAA
jgi:hypothetical protein